MLMKDRRKRISDLEAQLANEKRLYGIELEQFNDLKPVQQVATLLHEHFCTEEHQDGRTGSGCFWEKETWGSAFRRRYLDMAAEALELFNGDLETLKKVIELIAKV